MRVAIQLRAFRAPTTAADFWTRGRVTSGRETCFLRERVVLRLFIFFWPSCPDRLRRFWCGPSPCRHLHHVQERRSVLSDVPFWHEK